MCAKAMQCSDVDMIKTILLPLVGEETDRFAIETAVALARLFYAHMEFLFIRMDPVSVLLQAGAGCMGNELLAPGVLEELLAQERSRAGRATETFKASCERARIPTSLTPTRHAGVSASWREMTGNAVSVITEQARYFDIVVVGRRFGAVGLWPDEAGSILIGCGRPVLLAAHESPKQLTGTIAIAWKNIPEAARAVTAAMPLLRKAEKTVVFSIEEDQTGTSESLDRLVEHLQWHGLMADGKRMPLSGRRGPEVLLAAAGENSADLLVMGGYGHSRIREMIFGGFTRHVLEHCPIPVLLFH
jgi:nucleotide-binding universal stress UspA family protein